MPAKLDVQEHEEKASLVTQGGEDELNKVGGKNSGVPFLAFLDAKGDLIVNSLRPVEGKAAGSNIGHPYEPQEVDWFMVMVRKAAPGIEEGEAKTLENWLRNQKKK